MKSTITQFFLLALTSIFFSQHAQAQCNLTANAGPDQVICAPGGSVTLNGSVSGSFGSVQWTDEDGMVVSNDLTPTVNVTETTTFTLNAYGAGAISNIIVDGTFNTGGSFSSDYIPGTGGPFGLLSNEGEYAITTNSSLVHNNFDPCTAHGGSGNMLVVNGATTANENIWCQTVPVLPNTVYEFGTWVTSVLASNPAELQFSINGQLLGSTFNAGAPCSWNQFFEVWNSGSSNTATICIVNQNTQGSGNDFALDDITFGPVCSDEDEVTITVVDVVAMTNPDAVLPCVFGNGISLSGVGSSVGPNITYQWTTSSGNIVSGGNTLTPVIDATGLYELTVTLTVGAVQCTETATVAVTPDTDFPLATIAQPFPVTCTAPLSLLDGIGSSIGPNIIYQWTASNGGSFSGGTMGIQANASSAGTYTLVVTNTLNGCTDEESINVTSDINLPIASAVASGNINCNNPTVTISGAGSTPSGLDFSWQTTNGNITSASDIPIITVNAAGLYELTVTNPTSGCSDTELVAITANTAAPTATIATPGSLNCTTSSITLNASASTGTGTLSYNWATVGGNIVSGGQTANPVVNAVGTYIVTVTQSSNGCTATASVQVTGDNSLPTITIATPAQLTCTTNQTGLSATVTGSNQTYAWTTGGGTIVSGGNTLTPLVQGIGTYTLTVTQTNGCTAVSSVQVTNNLTAPLAEAGTPPTLNCQSITATLNGAGSASGAGISYLWTTPNGSITQDATTLTPLIASAGTYFLTVLNAANGCSATDSVVVQQNSSLPSVNIAPAVTLNCTTEEQVLNASNSSSGPNFQLTWTTTGGSFGAGQNTLTPTVTAPGVYTLAITNTASQCTSTASVTVLANFNTPVVSAGPPATLDCDLTTLQLGGSATNLGTNPQIAWTTTGGNIFAGANTLTPTINAPGTYVLIIKDLDSGCADTSQVVIGENVALPVANTGPTAQLTCAIASLNLNGSGSSQGPNFQYLWTTANGNIVSGETGLMPLVNAPGNYLLTVEDTTNGCSNVAIVAVTQNGNFPAVNPGVGAMLTCDIEEATLSATADSGPQFSYQWTTADGLISGGDSTLTPIVSDPGVYQLTVLNAQNGCSSTASVTVTEDLTPPLADAGLPGVLSCTMNQLTLNGTGSAPNSTVAFAWTTLNGNILSGENTTSATINAPGTYTLTVTNNANGCTEAASVQVSQDASLPVADAGTADDLNCIVSSVTLDGSGSSQGAGFTYQWTTANGLLQGDPTTLNPVAIAPGTYLLTVTNTASNCTTISSVTVLQDYQLPSADAGPDAQLTCTTTQLTLDGSDSSIGSNFAYNWTTTNGTILNGGTSLSPVITAPGLYLLEITNTVNGCTANNSVLITENTTPPAAVAATPGQLTCTVESLNLSGAGSSTGAGFSYLWTTTNGSIGSGANTVSPSVNAPGTYLLTVTNGATGCTNTAQVQVLENIVPPNAIAGPAVTLTCNDPSLSLNGAGSSQGAGFGYQWTTNGGNILSGATTLTPTVDAGGNYLLTVINAGNGCTATSQVAVQVNQAAPTTTISSPTPLTCVEQTSNLNGAGSSTGSQFVYTWTTVDGNFIGAQDALQTTVDQPGTYVLTIENTTNGCESNAQVVVDEDGDLPQVEAGQALELNCNAAQGNLLGSTDLAPGSWLAVWTTTDGNLVSGSNGLTPVVNAPGTYQLTVTNSATGCSNTDQVTVTEVRLLGFDFETVAPTCLTNEGQISFTDVVGGTQPYRYSVNGGASFGTSAVAVGLQPGNYDLVVQDADGCELEDTANLPSPPEVVVTLDANTIIDLGESYQLDAQTNLAPAEIDFVQWTPDATLSCGDCLSPLATPLQQTSYTVEIMSKEGCTAEATTTIFVKKEANIYVPNAFSPNGDGLNDVFMIFAGGKSVQEIKRFIVLDRWGETVYEYYNFQPNNPAYGWDGSLRDEPMNPAVYVWFAEAILIDGSLRLLKGDVNLIR